MGSLVLPYPPSANRYWRVFRGRAVTSAAATAYKRDIASLARSDGVSGPTMAPIALAFVLRPPRPLDGDRRERLQGPLWHLSVRCIDLDNAMKVCGDALQGIVYENDKQVVSLRIKRGIPVPNGALEVSWSICREDAIFP